jgi:ankyrin repeat protein
MTSTQAIKSGDIDSLNSCLRSACACGQLTNVKKLLANGADVNTTSGYPLRVACLHEHPQVVKLLLANGANVHAFGDYTINLVYKRNKTEIINIINNHLLIEKINAI